MTAAEVQFENNDQAAHAISHYLDRSQGVPAFSLRPYNRFTPEFTEWWFFPKGATWPGYGYTKLFVHSSQQPPDTRRWFYAGLYVEKGLGVALAGMPGVKRTHIMAPDWHWHNFVPAAKAGKLMSPIREVLERSRYPVVVSVSVHEFNKVPEPDTERNRPHDFVDFLVSDQTGGLTVAQSGKRTLASLNSCRTVSEVAGRLEALDGLDYFWLDFLVGIRLPYGGARGTWGAAEIWQKVLDPWCSWVAN